MSPMDDGMSLYFAILREDVQKRAMARWLVSIPLSKPTSATYSYVICQSLSSCGHLSLDSRLTIISPIG